MYKVISPQVAEYTPPVPLPISFPLSKDSKLKVVYSIYRIPYSYLYGAEKGSMACEATREHFLTG